uniref:Uncharacterized protein n=1 Tax=viral metagenome TaxID=1070528 RepID=A0A6M3LD45_9ZZZZ
MDKAYEDLKFAEEILSTSKTCENCWFYRSGMVLNRYHCALYSSECATQVFNHKELPSRWTSFEDGEEMDRLVMGRAVAVE